MSSLEGVRLKGYSEGPIPFLQEKERVLCDKEPVVQVDDGHVSKFVEEVLMLESGGACKAREGGH